MRNRNIKILILLSIFSLIFLIYNKTVNIDNNKVNTIINTDNVSPNTIIENKGNLEVISKDPTDITISAVGDILVHDTQLVSQYNKETDSYDFKDNFLYIKPFIEKSDLAICNLESTLAGKEKGYSGYPNFNSPDSILEALSYAGFDVIQNSNNHSIDYGSSGFIRTRSTIVKSGFSVIGTKEKKEDKNYIIKDVKGIKIGITAYTFESKRQGNSKWINSIPLQKNIIPLINSFSPSYLDTAIKEMKSTISNMKKDGADILIFSLHFGEEYESKPSAYQVKLASSLSDLGVDIILGGHPHVIAPFDVIESKISNKKTYVIYSLGNFLSNQCYERLQKRDVEDGMIINFSIRKDNNSNIVFVNKINFIPTWVYRWPKGNETYNYRIVPSEDAALNPDNFLITGDYNWRVQNSFKNTKKVVESLTKEITLVSIK